MTSHEKLVSLGLYVTIINSSAVLVVHVLNLVSFTVTVKVIDFSSDTFDLFNVMCKQHHRTAFNPILNGKKNSNIDGNCGRT